MKRILLTLGLVALAAISAACSSAAAQPAPSGPVDPNGPTIVAKDMKFSPPRVEVKAGENFTLHFDNQDVGAAQRGDLHRQQRRDRGLGRRDRLARARRTRSSRRSRPAPTSSAATSTTT